MMRHSRTAYPHLGENDIPYMVYDDARTVGGGRTYLGTFTEEQARVLVGGGTTPSPSPADVDPLLVALRNEVVHIPGEPGKPLTWEQLEKPHFVYGFRVNGRDGVDEVKQGFSHNPESVLTTAQRFTSRKLVLAFKIMVYTPGENNRAAAYALEQRLKREQADHLIPGGGGEVFDLGILPDWKEADLINGEVVPRPSSVETEVWEAVA